MAKVLEIPPMLLPSIKARGRSAQPRGSMNATERRYAEYLEGQRISGAVAWFAFEAVKLRLADHATFYSPDFMVMLPDGVIELHEVKGHWEDDARVKIKVAADKFPFQFIAVRPARGGGWKKERF